MATARKGGSGEGSCGEWLQEGNNGEGGGDITSTSRIVVDVVLLLLISVALSPC